MGGPNSAYGRETVVTRLEKIGSNQIFGMRRAILQKMVLISVFYMYCFLAVPAMHRTRQEVI